MKNFPHQYSELSRFRGTLEILSDLRAGAQNVLDNGVLGYELARAGVYKFRGDVPDLEARIAVERQKPEGRQGARTAAREGRRTLRLLGFIDATGALTASGTQLLEEAPGSAGEVLIWRQAVMALSLPDEQGNVSHPMRILLRLLADRGPLARIELALALEARDDGDVEYARVLSLIPIRVAIEREVLPVSKSVVDNAVKILPALALHLGLAADRGDDLLAITEIGDAVLRQDFQFGDIMIATSEGPPHARRRRVGARKREIVAGQRRPLELAEYETLTRDEQIETLRLRMERTTRHDDVVNKVAAAFREGFHVYEDRASYDALLVPQALPNDHFLLEIKTLDLDEVAQTNRAVGQLSWYLWGYVTPEYENVTVRLGVVFDRRPSEEICRYLQSLSIGVFCCTDLQIEACNDMARLLVPNQRAVPPNYATPEGA